MFRKKNAFIFLVDFFLCWLVTLNFFLSLLRFSKMLPGDEEEKKYLAEQPHKNEACFSSVDDQHCLQKTQGVSLNFFRYNDAVR